MNRQEYKSQNDKREAKRNKRIANEKQIETIKNRKWWQLRPAWWNIPSDRFAFFVAIFTAALAAVAFLQTCILNNQLDEMKIVSGISARQLAEIKRQSKSIERSSTSSRAYVFAKINVPNKVDVSPIGQQNFVVSVNFSLENFGQTPAVITKVETHVLISKSAQIIIEPPESGSALFINLHEDRKQPIVSSSPKNNLIIDESFPTPIIIPASSGDIPLTQNFFFYRPPTVSLPIPQIPGGVPMIPPHTIPITGHGAWFYCAISYKDIYGFERETVYYVGMFGAGIELPKNPTFNRWN